METMIVAGLVILILIAVAWKKISGAEVLQSVSKSRGLAPPDVSRWEDDARSFARQYNLPWEIVLAQIWQESWGDPSVVGSAGEVGLMQLKQIAIDDLLQFGYDVPPNWHTNTRSNIKAGTQYLHLQLRRTGVLADALGKVKADALESYNEGFGGTSKDLGPDEYTNEVLAKARKLGYTQ